MLDESPNDDRNTPGDGEATRASSSLGFGIVADKMFGIRHRGGPLEKLNTEKVSNEGSRGAEDEDPGFLLSSGIESVPWVKK